MRRRPQPHGKSCVACKKPLHVEQGVQFYYEDEKDEYRCQACPPTSAEEVVRVSILAYCLNCKLALADGDRAFPVGFRDMLTDEELADGFVCRRCFHALCIQVGMSETTRNEAERTVGIVLRKETTH